MKNIEQTLRDEIERSGLTIYSLWRDTGLHTASLVNFMSGKSLRSDKFSRLAEHLGYELRKVEKPKTTKGK